MTPKLLQTLASLKRETLPSDEKAIIIDRKWNKKEITWPYKIWIFETAKVFIPHVIHEWEKWFLVDEKWKYTEISWPSVVRVHPEWEYIPHKKINLARHEVVVIIDEDWKYKIFQWSENPIVWVTSKQRLHTFRWTWSKWDTEEKSPWSLAINTIRLQETSTYFSFNVRTKDNIVIKLRLTIYFWYRSVEELLKSDDPTWIMYNKIMSSLVNYVAKLNFEDFKEWTNDKISSFELFKRQDKDNLWFFRKVWINISEVVVREWAPINQPVQRILEEAATVQTQKTLDKAAHERNLERIKYESIELDENTRLQEKQKESSKAKWIEEAERMKAIFSNIKGEVWLETARTLLLIMQASKADALYLSPEMLKNN